MMSIHTEEENSSIDIISIAFIRFFFFLIVLVEQFHQFRMQLWPRTKVVPIIIRMS